MKSDLNPQALQERIRILEAENKQLKNILSSSSNTHSQIVDKFKMLFDSSSDAIFLIENEKGQILEANKTATTLYGYSYEELINLKNTDLSNEPAQTRKITQTGAPIVLERWHRKKDGTIFPVEITGSFFDLNGQSVHIASIRDITKRVEAFESLRVSEKIFRSYFDLSLVGVAITHPNMAWIKVNATLCQMLGYSCDELLTKTWAELTPEDDLRAEMIRFKRALSNPSFVQSRFTKRLIRKDGSIIIVDLATSVHRKDDGQIDFMLSMIQDITQRIETEVALIESELRFRELVDLLPQTVFETDMSGTFTFINQYAEKEFGYTQNDAINKMSFTDTLTPQEKKRFFENFNGVPEVGRTGREYILQRKDRSTFTGLIHYNPIIRNNQPAGMLGILTNIQEQKEVEKKLRESEENYHTIFELASDSIIIHDPETGEILDANQNAIYSYGLKTIEELRNHPFWTEKPPYCFEDAMHWIKKSVADGPQIFEWLNRRTDGAFFWEEVHLSFIKILGVNRVVSISRNITARKKAEEKLEKANFELKLRNQEYAALNEEYATQNEELFEAKEKAVEADRLKSAFLANMSHEIRTPMNAIMGFSGLLTNRNIDNEKQNLYAQIIKKRSADLLKIIDDILDISKIEANQLEIKESSGNINVLLNELLDYFLTKKEMDNKNNLVIKTSSQLSDSDAKVVADFGRLKQILFNLTENALKFTEKGDIEISCKILNNSLLFSVKDTGIGIDSSMHDIIFQRFRQAAEQQEEITSGTGLGLAICKGLVELMGGEIWLKSEPKIGSEFFFTIPIKYTSYIEEREVPQKFSKKSLNKKTVLIVEDDEINTHFLKEVLEMAMATTLTALDGKTALSIFESYPSIDAILLDIKLPHCNGLDLIPKFRSINPNIIVIIESAYATNEDIEAGFSAGCDAYLTKPTDANVLVATIIDKLNGSKLSKP